MKELIEKIWYEDFKPSEKHFAYGEEIHKKHLLLVNYEKNFFKN